MKGALTQDQEHHDSLNGTLAAIQNYAFVMVMEPDIHERKRLYDLIENDLKNLKRVFGEWVK